MTLKELYSKIEGDYDMAMQILRIEKLLDKHIRKLPDNQIFIDFEAAGKAMDGNALFESAHAIKGVCANLGLVKLSKLASDVTEEFRPGNERCLSDEEVRCALNAVNELYNKTCIEIQKYETEA